MTAKISFSIVIFLIAAFLGWSAHRWTSEGSESDLTKSSTSSDEWSVERAQLEAELDASDAKALAHADTIAKLEAELESLRAAVASSKNADAPTTEEAMNAALDKLAIAFGDYATVDGVLDADWEEMAAASKELQSALRELSEMQARGEAPDAAMIQRIQTENGKLVSYAVSIMGKIPTEAPVNGEFTHPITTANLMSAILDSDGMPLTEDQRSRFSEIGSQYDLAYSSLQDQYDDSTPKVTRFVDEFELKHETKLAFESTLSRDQLQGISPDEYRNRVGTDILSPNLMTQMSIAPSQYSSSSDLQQKLPETFGNRYGLSSADVDTLRVEFDRWIQDLGPYTAPRTRSELAEMRTDESLVSARAHARCVEAALQHLQLDDETRQQLLSDSGWILPQVVASSSPAEESDDD